MAKPVDYSTLVRAIEEALSRAKPVRSTPDPTSQPEVGEQPPPQFDRAILDKTLSFLIEDEISANLQYLRLRQQQMLQLLDQPDTAAQQADVAHGLASAAGMFGFIALSRLSRNFEHAVMEASPDVARLADRLRTETGVALVSVTGLMQERGLQPA